MSKFTKGDRVRVAVAVSQNGIRFQRQTDRVGTVRSITDWGMVIVKWDTVKGVLHYDERDLKHAADR